MYKIALTLVILLSGAAASFAQNPTNYIRTDLIPASPNASDLGRYGEVPINLSTGSAGLSIPVFTVTGRDLSLPITLNYNYGGFRPAESVGWIGLGWNLSAGGVISRTVKGRLDNSAGPGFNFQDPYVKGKINSATKDLDFLNYVYEGTYDTEPDMFSFNFGKYSGKFIYYKNKYYCFPYQKLKITGSEILFTIVAEDGTSYRFDRIESTKPKGSSGAPFNLPPYNSSWYLTKITNASNNEHITLTYNSEGEIPRIGTTSQTFKKFLSQNGNYQNMHTDELLPVSRSFPTYVSSVRLASISSEKFSVNFLPGPKRTDIYQGTDGDLRMLDQITVSNTLGIPIKSMSLKHSYSAVLMLDSVIDVKRTVIDGDIIQIDNAQSQKYAFTYNAVPESGPDVATDDYGFYRGGSNTMLLPIHLYPNGADRSPNENVMAGAMMSVTYPTKGYTTFEYEPNLQNNGVDYVKTSKNVTETLIRPSNNLNGLISGDYRTFILNYQQQITVVINRTPKSPYADGNSRNAYKDFEITTISNSNFEVVASDAIYSEADNHYKAFTYTLAPGTYYFQVYCDNKENALTGTVEFKYKTDIPIEGKRAGGARVKKIVNFPIQGFPVSKEYKYTDNAGFSTGSSVLPVYESRLFIQREMESALNWYEIRYQVSSSFVPESYFIGVPHWYSSVAESTVSGSERLTTRTDYTSFNDYFMGIETAATTQYKIEGGVQKPVQRTEYNYVIKEDTVINSLKPIQTMSGPGSAPNYDYDVSYYQYRSAWKYPTATKTINYIGADTLQSITYNDYDVNNTRNLLATRVKDSRGRTIVTRFKYPESYSSSINNPYVVAHVLDPVFDKQTWLKRSSDSTLLSSVVTQYSPVLFKPTKIHTLSASNISSLNNESRDGGGLYNYLLSDNRLEERVNFGYDAIGSLTDQQLKFGAAISYKWGYKSADYYDEEPNQNKQFVIAECKNATSSEFFHNNFEETATSNSVNPHTGRYYAASYTVDWIKPNTRNYIITYWYRVNGLWLFKKDNYMGTTYTCAGGDGYDDVNIYPADAQITTYTYNPGVGVTSIIDARGETSTFEYDGFNRLTLVRDRDGNILKSNEYYLAGTNIATESAGPYLNSAVSQSFIRNDCGPNYVGSSVLYTVTAGKYSGITQQAADAKALADLQTTGQNRANQFGTCTYTGIAVE